MSNDLIAVLGARLDQFQADLDQAGNMADSAIDRIEDSFAKLNPSFGGLSRLPTLFTGVTAAAAAALTALESINNQIASIGKNAEYVGLSTDRLQQIKFAATQGGVSGGAATDDLKHAADLLADAKNNENSLTKLLDANNIKYKDRNGDVINLNALLKIAADLLGRFDSIPEKTKAAQMLGLSAAWVDALKGGSAAFEKVANSADDAGAVIDKATIAKAQNFAEAWKRSTDSWSYQFKSVAGDVAGWLNDLIDKATEFVSKMQLSGGIGGGSGQDRFNAIADALDVVRKDATGVAQDLDQVNRVLERYGNSAHPDTEVVAKLEEIRAKAKAAADEVIRLAQAQSRQDFPGGVPLPSARPAGADEKTGDGKLPVRKQDNSRDQFEIAVDQITKRTATINADTAATFQNNAAQAQFRAEFQELTAIMRDHGEVTQAQIDLYEKFRQSMSAQQALEAAGITLTQKHADAFLSSSTAIGAATTGYDKARDSLSKINSASSQIGSALSSAFADAVVEGKNLNDVLASLEKTFAKSAINSLFSSFFNAPSSGGLSPFAAIFKGLIPGFADGTDSAPGGLAWVGERGPELVNLPKGSQVIPNVQSRAAGPTFQTTYQIDATGADAAAIERVRQQIVAVNSSVESRALAAFTKSQMRFGR